MSVDATDNAGKDDRKQRGAGAQPALSIIPTKASKIESVVVGSSLYQVLSLLSLSRLHDARNMAKIVQNRELASLAFARVVDGRIILEVEPEPGGRRRKKGGTKSQVPKAITFHCTMHKNCSMHITKTYNPSKVSQV